MDEQFLAFEAQVKAEKRQRKEEKKKKKKSGKKNKKRDKKRDKKKKSADKKATGERTSTLLTPGSPSARSKSHSPADVTVVPLANYDIDDGPMVVDMSLDLSKPLEPLTFETLTIPDAAPSTSDVRVAPSSWKVELAAAPVSPQQQQQQQVPAEQTKGEDFQSKLNYLMAQATRAQLRDDREEYERVAKSIEALQRGQTEAPEVVVVPDVDSRGSAVLLPQSVLNAQEGSIAAMVAEERGLRRPADTLRQVLRGGTEEEEEYGELVGGASGTLDFSTGRGQPRKNKKQKVTVIDNTRKPQQSLRSMAMQEQILARCSMCHRRPELLVATARHSYLMLPGKKGLHPFHCYIVPLEHVASFASADVELLQELDLWKRSLVRMLRACKTKRTPSFECVFIETVVRLDRLPHTIIECIPVPNENAGDISLYFHKAISEEGELWSTNPKITDTKGKRLHQCIPKEGFPYIHVEWDTQRESRDVASKESAAAVARGGIAHVIDDDKHFKRNFGRQVVGGILGLDVMQISGGQELPKDTTRRVQQFRTFFSPGYDFTQFITD